MITANQFSRNQRIATIRTDTAAIQAKSQQNSGLLIKLRTLSHFRKESDLWDTFMQIIVNSWFDRDGGGVWCYTNDPNVRWEYCPVPDCRNPADKWWWEQPEIPSG